METANPTLNLDIVISKLTRKLWRLNNLYYIRDKYARKIQFRLNKAQRKISSYTHNKKIILKSRQQGISTFYLLNNLDDCLVIPGFQAGIQSYGEDESKKLAKRALFAWENIDQDIKDLIGYLTIGEPLQLVTSNTKEFSWNNGSTLKIGNFRGDTLQSLHVSELGKISKKYPEKAKELKTGAFQAVASNNKITIESTAEGRSGLFYELWEQSVRKTTLTPLDFQAIFLSWVEDPDCQLDYKVDIPDEFNRYFSKLEKEENIHLTDKQKWWYTKKKEELGDDMFQEYPTTPEEAFMVVKDGSYYMKLYQTYIVKKNRLITNLYDKNLDVNVAMDLGINDTMVLVFFQVYEGLSGLEIRIIDEYHNSGEPLKHYVDIMNLKSTTVGYVYDKVHVPHDATVRELGTGKTRLSILRELGVNASVLPKTKILDGIELVRKYISYMYIDNSLTYIQKTFQNYRKSWNDKLGVWNSEPIHDEWSHPADAIRYMCQSISKSKFNLSKPTYNTKNTIDL